jgi:hypothetical protein
MRKTTILIVLIVTFVLAAYANFIFLEYTATPATNKVTLSWLTKSEASVSKFVILRSTDDDVFNEIGSVTAKGAGNQYKYIDENVIFKGNQTFFYKLRALNSNNSIVEETESLIVNPNISGIFRTWGAIKAMFR